MKTLSAQSILLSAAMLLRLGAAPAAAQDAATGDMTMINPSTLRWVNASSGLPKGTKFAVLYGNPGRDGLYVVRLETPGGYKVPPHWHTETENLAVISGTLYLGSGNIMDVGAARALETDGFHNLPGDMHHYTFTKVATVVQVHGTGPLDIRYVNPQDDPSPKQWSLADRRYQLLAIGKVHQQPLTRHRRALTTVPLHRPSNHGGTGGHQGPSPTEN